MNEFIKKIKQMLNSFYIEKKNYINNNIYKYKNLKRFSKKDYIFNMIICKFVDSF